MGKQLPINSRNRLLEHLPEQRRYEWRDHSHSRQVAYGDAPSKPAPAIPRWCGVHDLQHLTPERHRAAIDRRRQPEPRCKGHGSHLQRHIDEVFLDHGLVEVARRRLPRETAKPRYATHQRVGEELRENSFATGVEFVMQVVNVVGVFK